MLKHNFEKKLSHYLRIKVAFAETKAVNFFLLRCDNSVNFSIAM